MTSSSHSFHRDQLMNAHFKRVGSGAMAIANTVQNMTHPGERLAALLFVMKCLVDRHNFNLGDMLRSVSQLERDARENYSPELSGARAYIENEVHI